MCTVCDGDIDPEAANTVCDDCRMIDEQDTYARRDIGKRIHTLRAARRIRKGAPTDNA